MLVSIGGAVALGALSAASAAGASHAASAADAVSVSSCEQQEQNISARGRRLLRGRSQVGGSVGLEVRTWGLGQDAEQHGCRHELQAATAENCSSK